MIAAMTNNTFIISIGIAGMLNPITPSWLSNGINPIINNINANTKLMPFSIVIKPFLFMNITYEDFRLKDI